MRFHWLPELEAIDYICPWRKRGTETDNKQQKQKEKVIFLMSIIQLIL